MDFGETSGPDQGQRWGGEQKKPMGVVWIVLRRLATLALVLVGVTIVTFVISRLIPGDPAQLIAGPRATPEAVAAIRAELKLDAPIHEQYWTYAQGLLKGDLGTSIMSGRPVAAEIFHYMPATVELMLTALLLSLAIGVPLGVLTALHKDRTWDVLGRTFAIAGISVPSFWVGLLLLLLFYNVLSMAPGSGRLDRVLTPPDAVTGMYVVDGLIAANWIVVQSALNHLILPALALAITSLGVVVRLIRASLIEVLSQDYVRTATAFGVPRSRIVWRYALPNALIPFVTVLGLELSSLLFGSVVIESVFGWPGLGSFVLAAILNLDFPVIMGFAVVASIVYVAANLIVDLMYMVLDPRVRSVS